jgi:hypothetical protein
MLYSLKVRLHEKKIFEMSNLYGIKLKVSTEGFHKKDEKNPQTLGGFTKKC